MTHIIHAVTIAFLVMFVLARITRVGAERKPITPGEAAAVTLVGGVLIMGLVYAWTQT